MSDVTALAIQAAEHWGGVATPPRLIRDRENAVFEVHLKGGTHAALRLHRPGYQTPSAIASELIWTEALAKRGFPCPMPIRAETGVPTIAVEQNQSVSVVTWIDAEPIGENGVPFTGTASEHCALYERLGTVIRKLHKITDEIDTDGLTRPSWSADALLGAHPHWGRFWENPALGNPDRLILKKARKNAAQQLSEINSLDKGLIHADLLQENILQNADGLHIIDFDDSGTGYRLFDLGTALIQHAEHPHLPELTKALCAGYGCSTEHMPLFVMLRSMASCGWIMSRTTADDPRLGFYANRALRCSRHYLDAVC